MLKFTCVILYITSNYINIFNIIFYFIGIYNFYNLTSLYLIFKNKINYISIFIQLYIKFFTENIIINLHKFVNLFNIAFTSKINIYTNFLIDLYINFDLTPNIHKVFFIIKINPGIFLLFCLLFLQLLIIFLKNEHNKSINIFK